MSDSFVTFQTSQGLELRGSLISLSRYQAIFEVYNPAAVLLSSEVLEHFRILTNGQLIYSGKAVTTNLINSGVAIVCQANLEDVWVNLDQVYAGLSAERLKHEFNGFFRDWQNHFRLSAEYRLFVSEFYSYFHDLRLWLEQVEMGLRSQPTSNNKAFEHELLEQLGHDAISVFQHFVERFEVLCAGLPAESVPAHQAYMRRQMHPLLLCSPFVYRTFAKPLGYAGDYEMINMLFRDPFEGATLFAKVVNFCFLNQGSTFAHRNRVDYLLQNLVTEGMRLARTGRGLRVLSVGCGPALEVQRFLAHGSLAAKADFELLDFNSETLEHTRHALDLACRQHGAKPSIRVTRKSVIQMLKEAGRSAQGAATQSYDYIYCAGLFDYLTDPICRRLMDVMFQWLAPGGLLVATNVTPANPIRYGMEHVLDWTLVYRTASQMMLLKPDGEQSETKVAAETCGVNLWLEVRKANHG